MAYQLWEMSYIKIATFFQRIFLMASFLFDGIQLSGIPATMALAVVALIGYLAGRQSRAHAETSPRSAEILERALADARHLEQLTDAMLSATREALHECRQLKMHTQIKQPRAPERTVAVG